MKFQMKYDHDWLQKYHDFQTTSDFLEDLVTKVPIRDRFVIAKAHKAIKVAFDSRVNDGLSIEREWTEINQLTSLAVDLAKAEENRCAAYS